MNSPDKAITRIGVPGKHVKHRVSLLCLSQLNALLGLNNVAPQGRCPPGPVLLLIDLAGAERHVQPEARFLLITHHRYEITVGEDSNPLKEALETGFWGSGVTPGQDNPLCRVAVAFEVLVE